MSTASLETLPNELLQMIGSYLTSLEMHLAFSNLNVRLSNVVQNYKGYFDLTQLNYQNFQKFNELLSQYNLGAHIRSLSLSNNKPVIGQIGLLFAQMCPLYQTLPNLKSLVLFSATVQELKIFLPDIRLLEQLTKLFIEFDVSNAFEHFNAELFKELIENLGSVREFSLKGIWYTRLSISDWFNDTITHLTIDIGNAEHLLKIIHTFHGLQFLSVTMVGSNTCDPILSAATVPALQLTEFRIKSSNDWSLATFNDFIFLMEQMPNIRFFQCQMTLNCEKTNEKCLTYMNGEHWHVLQTQLNYLIHFDCSIRCTLSPTDVNDEICQRIGQSFSPFPYWFVNVYQLVSFRTDIYACTKRPHRCPIVVEPTYFEQGDDQKIRILIVGASSVTINWNDYERDDEIPILKLSPANFPHVKAVKVGSPYLYFDNQLKEFLEQLFDGTSHLNEIEIHTYNDESGIDNILNVLHCLQKPTDSVKNLVLNTNCPLDEMAISIIAHYLPCLVSITIHTISAFDNVVEIVDACLNEIKHLTYLELGESFSDSWDDIFQSKLHLMEDDVHSWLLKYTILGNSMMQRPFYACCSRNLKIWL